MEQLTRERLIILLNEDIQLEYAAAIQYIQHYAAISGAQYDAIRAHLLTHSEEEIGHAVKLSDRVNYMGGIPTPGVGPIKISANPIEMLQMNLASEGNAIARYKQRIEQAVLLKEYGLVTVLQGILTDEEEHENDLETTLGMDKTKNVAPEAPEGGPVDDIAPVVMARFAALDKLRKLRTRS